MIHVNSAVRLVLKRIIQASSNEGDVVLDPFAGCGTTIAAAQKLNRQWIGIDVTQLSIALLKNRLEGNFGMIPIGQKKAASIPSPKGTKIIAQGKAEPGPPRGQPEAGWGGRHPGNDPQTDSDPEGVEQPAADVAPLQGASPKADISPGFHPGLLSSSPSATGGTYAVIGEPVDPRDARILADSGPKGRYQFQYWALSQINARPLGGEMDGRTGKKGSDKGIDGIKVFVDDTSGKAKRVIVQVKSGHVKSGDIRDLVGTVDREGAAIGVFITLEKATSHMIDEAASAGFFTSEHFGKFPRIQILTIEEIIAGKTVQMPQTRERTFKQAEKITNESKDQRTLEF